MKYTEFNYIYRDEDNYKIPVRAIIEGTFTEKQIKEITEKCLDDGLYMIPSQIGLPYPRFDEETDADHPWYELRAENIKEIIELGEDDEAYLVDITIDELYNNFLKSSGNWNKKVDY